MKRLVFFMCALAFLRFEAEAQVAPLWSVPVGETRADLQPLLVDEPVSQITANVLRKFLKA